MSQQWQCFSSILIWIKPAVYTGHVRSRALLAGYMKMQAKVYFDVHHKLYPHKYSEGAGFKHEVGGAYLYSVSIFPRKMKDELRHNGNTSVIARPNHERQWERERDRNRGNTTVNGRGSMESSGRCCATVCQPLTTGTWDSSKTGVLFCLFISLWSGFQGQIATLTVVFCLAQ